MGPSHSAAGQFTLFLLSSICVIFSRKVLLTRFLVPHSLQVLLMDNPSSVLIDIHSLDSTPAEHDRNLTNKVSIIDSLNFES